MSEFTMSIRIKMTRSCAMFWPSVLVDPIEDEDVEVPFDLLPSKAP